MTKKIKAVEYIEITQNGIRIKQEVPEEQIFVPLRCGDLDFIEKNLKVEED